MRRGYSVPSFRYSPSAISRSSVGSTIVRDLQGRLSGVGTSIRTRQMAALPYRVQDRGHHRNDAGAYGQPEQCLPPGDHCFTSTMLPIFHDRSKNAFVGEYQRK